MRKKRYNNQEGVNMYDKNHVYFYEVKYDITGEGVLKIIWKYLIIWKY